MLGSRQVLSDCLASEYILMQIRLRRYTSGVSVSCGLCDGCWFLSRNNSGLVVAGTVTQTIMRESGQANRVANKKKPMGQARSPNFGDP